MEFIVRVPEGTPHGMRVFLSGDDAALGCWSADAVPLVPQHDGTYRVMCEVDAEGRFLVTLGRWRFAECDSAGRELPPRTLPSTDSIVVDVAGWGRTSVRHHLNFVSRHLPRSRTISVYLPPGYDLEPTRRYPVFYLQDGQNLFDPETAFCGNPWWADEVAERVIRRGEVQPIILVGVANTANRMREYGPRRSQLHRHDDWSQAYGRMLVEEVKTLIDTTYRTRTGPEATAIGGSSLGALIALHLCKWYPGTFGLCAAMSPSLWWDGESFLRTIGEKPGWLTTSRVWLDMGDHEGGSRSTQRGGIRRIRKLADEMKRYGIGARLRMLEIPGGHHSERDWGSRFDQVLRFLFGPGSR